jgi:hypothetical protein
LPFPGEQFYQFLAFEAGRVRVVLAL